MISNNSYKKILFALFSVCIILLLSHLAVSLISSEEDLQRTASISEKEIDKTFKESLHSFAIKDEWIKTLKTKSGILTYSVILPSDLPIPQILSELVNTYSGFGIEVKAVEKQIFGRTSVEIISNRQLKLKADFKYDKDIHRTDVEAALFIFGREKNEAEFDSLMLNTTRDYSVLLVPSKSNSAYSKWLHESGFEFAVLINNDINDLEFRLKEDFSEKRLKLVAQNLVVSFPNALFYVIDKKSDIFQTASYAILKQEFKKREIRFLTSDSLNFITSDQPDPSKRFSSIVKNITLQDIHKIAVPLDVYYSINEEIRKLVRVGYKFVKSSESKKDQN